MRLIEWNRQGLESREHGDETDNSLHVSSRTATRIASIQALGAGAATAESCINTAMHIACKVSPVKGVEQGLSSEAGYVWRAR